MKKIILSTGIILCSIVFVNAQKGSNIIQVSGQVGLPVGDLADVAKVGYGGAVKGMYGFGAKEQHVTLEAGYNYFPVKDLPDGVSANYSAIPIYTGYRYSFSNFHFESQAGISINKITGTVDGKGSKSETMTNFAWALGASYTYNNIELGVRYQSSETKKEKEDITFIGIRLAYNFTL